MKARLGLFSLSLIATAAMLSVTTTGAATPAVPNATTAVSASPSVTPTDPELIYDRANLSGIISRQVFEAAYESIEAHGLETDHGTLAIADMSQPSTARRLVLVDLESRALIMRTWVAHGSGSGGLMAERFSNRNGSHATSLGLYRVGARIESPKHGASLLLDGLDRGVNDLARPREVIIHGADYVSKGFIARTGSLGRSWGCPAVPRTVMQRMIAELEGDGLLYVYGT